ncbi:DUF6250 domain-containing protein [Oleiharenicola lentus]|uniref:DUF6250 domain-containing protein n=1 Tax=Oleiharenicola lentus TaxID=2508720 RepID=UPI003F673957
MSIRTSRWRGLLFLFLGVGAWAMAPHNPGPFDCASNWVVEQMPGGTVEIAPGRLTIQDRDGCTVWWKEKLKAPLTITYEATVVNAGGPLDRVSDMNCFWLATDPRSPGDLFFKAHGRNGKFETYDGLRTYYVGQGGNDNTTTRFRRYAGGGVKPLLPEHDRREAAGLLEGNRPYRIKIIAQADGVVRYYRDDILIFEFKDPEPLREGWFGFRTVHSHLRIRDLKIERATP